ncbi:MAG: M56 family metallopeptidase [Bacteroidales bacterium]|nr:M56 family metallopeptidase [Bacteroidales bacterium]
MTEFLIYQSKAAIALAVFYMFYRLLLSKETFHRLNRIVLLGTAALSFVLPLCVITFKKVVVLPAMKASSESYAGEMAETVAMAAEASEPIWPVILCSLFAAGALVVLIKTLVSIISIRRIIRSGSSQTLESGETLIITETDTAPFSWMKFIVLSREDYECGYTQILTHEKAHIALRHSWDLLFTDLITTFQWFNPAIWMLRADLRALHEFEADDAVLRSGADIREYQYLLIRKAVSKSGYSVANSLNHSTLKQRITMMLNKKSSRMSAWKALYVIPLVGISLAATAETKVDYQYEDQQHVAAADTPADKDSKKSFRKKNVSEARLIVDETNGAVTMIYYGLDGKEYKSEWSGLNLSENVYLVNGAVVTDKTLFDKETRSEDIVVLNSYLKNGKKVMAVVTPDREFVEGKAHLEINRNLVTYEDPQNIAVENVENANNEIRIGSAVRIGSMDEKGNDVDVDKNGIIFVVNGERMPEGFDMNTIDPDTITSIEVLKTEKALQEYNTDKGVIVLTTDPSKANEKKPVPDIYIDGKKATSEEIAALPANPKGTVAADGTVWITTEDETVEKPDPDEVVYVVTDKAAELIQNREPRFQGGGMPEFQKWVHDHIKYPEGVTSEGRVDVSFTVSKDGGVTDVKILRGADTKLNEEAIRVIESSGNGWVPAIKDGKKIPITMMIPVIFKK